MPRNVSQVKIGCRIFAQRHPSTVALAPECNHMKFTGKVEKRNSILKMQLRCDAGKVHSYLYKCRSWPRIGRMSCGSARASFGGEGKNEPVSGKGDDRAGKVEPVYEPISFSAKAPSSIYYFMPPQSAVSRPTALSGGQIVCSPTICCILSSLKTSQDTPISITLWASTH